MSEPQQSPEPPAAFAAVTWPLRGPRVSLRPVTAADVGAAWAIYRLESVQEWITTASPDVEAFRAYFLDPARMATTLAIEIDGPDGPRMIGDVMLKVEDAWTQAEVRESGRRTQAELGWVLDPAHGGRGYATEAVRLAIDLCFGPLGLRRVHAGCFSANEPSWRLMERLGMRREEDSRETALHRSGRWMDGMNYAVLASEWAPGARAGSGAGAAPDSPIRQ